MQMCILQIVKACKRKLTKNAPFHIYPTSRVPQSNPSTAAILPRRLSIPMEKNQNLTNHATLQHRNTVN